MAKVGDLVRAVDDCGVFYRDGALARLTHFDADGHAWGDFRDLGNADGSFDPDCDGTWCLGTARGYKLVRPS